MEKVNPKDKAGMLKIVKKLIDTGKSKGSLTYSEIVDELEDVELSPEQIEQVYEALESMGIEDVYKRQGQCYPLIIFIKLHILWSL